jgi:hypothetical protein
MSQPKVPSLRQSTSPTDKPETGKAGLWAGLRSCGPLWQTFGLSLLILCLLEIWHPYHFLTDDNLTYVLPVMVTMGRNMAQGSSPFVNQYLFGDGINLLHDPSNLAFWNPFVLGATYLCATVLKNTNAYLGLVDFCAWVYFVLCAVSFALLLSRLRQWRSLPLSNGRIVLLSLSYTFSSFALMVGSAWVMFLANQAMLPILLMGILHPQRAKGVAWVTLGMVASLLMGHLSPFLFTIFFLAVFVFYLCLVEKNVEPLLRCLFGGLAALLLVSPLLWITFANFSDSARSAPLSVAKASVRSVSFSVLLSSFFGGWIFVIFGLALKIHWVDFGQPIASCAASFMVFHSFRARQRMTGLQAACLCVALVVILFVVRPPWLGAVVSHLPLYRSLRLPFREIFIALFFVHVWIALRPVALSRTAYRATTFIGVTLFLLSKASFNDWSFAPRELDRNLIMSGQADEYWSRIKARLKPGDRLIFIIPPDVMGRHYWEVPFTLLGGYNYPALFEVHSATGYTAVGLARWGMEGTPPYHASGVFAPERGHQLLKQYPHLKGLRLVSMNPLRIDFCTGLGQTALELPPLAKIEGR